MKPFPNAKSAGFTLVELMITLMVLVILVSLGMPSFLQMLRNAEIRAAAEGVANGLQRARAEAVSRNAKVQFVLGIGTSWRVDLVPAAADPIDARTSNEGSPNAAVLARAINPATLVVDADSPLATTATFNQLGQVVANSPVSPTLAQVDVSAAVGTQGLRVTIGAGGNTRVCDPNVSAPNVRAC